MPLGMLYAGFSPALLRAQWVQTVPRPRQQLGLCLQFDQAERERQKPNESRGRSAAMITHVSKWLLWRLCDSGASKRTFQPTNAFRKQLLVTFLHTLLLRNCQVFVCMWEADKPEVGASLCWTKQRRRQKPVRLICPLKWFWPSRIIFGLETIYTTVRKGESYPTLTSQRLRAFAHLFL